MQTLLYKRGGEKLQKVRSFQTYIYGLRLCCTDPRYVVILDILHLRGSIKSTQIPMSLSIELQFGYFIHCKCRFDTILARADA